MTLLGPVANAAHGAKGNPTFNLLVGFAIFALTWFGRGSGEDNGKVKLSVQLG